MRTEDYFSRCVFEDREWFGVEEREAVLERIEGVRSTASTWLGTEMGLEAGRRGDGALGLG